jgi:hypothetical protein
MNNNKPIKSSFIYEYDANNLEKLQNKLEEALDFLNSFKKTVKLVKNQSGYEAIFYIAKILGFHLDSIKFNIFDEKKAHIVYGNILNFLYKIDLEYDFDSDTISKQDPTNEASYNEKCITIFCMAVYTCNLLMTNLFRFKLEFQKTKGLKALLKFLADKKFLDKNKNSTINPFDSAKLSVIDYLALNLSSLSNNCQDYKDLWNQMDAVNIMLRLADKRPSAKEYCFNVILNVANDYQIETLDEIKSYVKIANDKLEKVANDFKIDKFGRFNRQILNEDGIVVIQIHCLKDVNNVYSSMIILFNNFYNLCVNDMLKNEIFFNSNMKENIKIILTKGNDWEKHFCLKLLSQLTLSENVAINLNKDEEFIDEINRIPFISEKVNEYIDQINWNLNVTTPDQKNDLNEEFLLNHGHIMISYEKTNQDLCLNIKSILESSGYKVWIDLENKHGSVSESMAKAIENSICVLICVTEKFRQSVNARLESHYAYRLNKPIIPLIMQNGYENTTGWLGVIMCDKIYIDFVKCSFDLCMNRLKNEIDSKIKYKIFSKNLNKPSLNMGEDDVKIWFKENEIDELIIKYLNKCDGLILKQLYDIKQTNPQFYDQSLSNIDGINMISILKFNAALEKLFV